jgi:phage shock protein A
MIVGKIWSAVRAQLNKLANLFWTADPVAQMQYEYDRAVDQLKEGRVGLEQYRALVERVSRQVAANKATVANLEARVKAYLQQGNRDVAAKFAVELQRAQKELAENENQLKMHEEAYNNNLTKIQHAGSKLAELRGKIQKYDADLKMSRAEAELAKLAEDFHFNVTTDFGQIEQVVQDQIGLNRAKARVAADLSREGLDEIKAEEAVARTQAEEVLKNFEQQMGLVTPETGRVTESTKELGPARARETTTQSR